MSTRVTALLDEAQRAERCAREAVELGLLAARLMDGISDAAYEAGNLAAARAEDLAEEIRKVRDGLEAMTS